jgi:hypothetical protein
MERVALARLVNKEIRTLAERLDIGEESHAYAWMCACGCFTIVTGTLAEFDASAEQLFAGGHPLDEERATATQAYERAPDPAAIARRVDEKKRRELTRDLTRRLERQVMTNNGAT